MITGKTNHMKIAIIGHGYVGKAIEKLFHEHAQLIIYDPAEFPADRPDFKLEIRKYVNECDLAVICVPTPMSEDGKCDTSLVEETLEWLATPLVLIKSTIPPGTTEILQAVYGKRICFSPEYIGEGKYFVQFWKYPHPTEMKYHDFMIIGGEEPIRSRIVDIFAAALGPGCRFHKTDSKTAELVKYMENSWGAMKVTFANEFFEIAKAFGVDYQEARELFLLDGRVERMHTMVRADSRGFGGKCFPKDVNAIVKASERSGYEPKLLKQVLKSNDEFRNTNASGTGNSGNPTGTSK